MVLVRGIALTIVGSFLYSLISGNPFTWIQIAAAALGVSTYHFLAPLLTVMYKNYRKEPYHGSQLRPPS